MSISIAGLRLDRTPQTPVKKATVDLKDEVLRKGPNPQEKAKYLAMEILKSEIEKDPQFRSCHHWEVESMEVDLMEYSTPNLTTKLSFSMPVSKSAKPPQGVPR